MGTQKKWGSNPASGRSPVRPSGTSAYWFGQGSRLRGLESTLQRALYQQKLHGQDVAIATATADHYILGWPHRLDDGTFSRVVTGDWPGEKSTPTGSIVWGDDQTMGTVLVARMAPLFNGSDYAAEVTRQQIGFAKRLRDPEDGLNYHGYNEEDGHDSCCKWGRGQCLLLCSV